jgi:hypothetical protein
MAPVLSTVNMKCVLCLRSCSTSRHLSCSSNRRTWEQHSKPAATQPQPT